MPDLDASLARWLPSLEHKMSPKKIYKIMCAQVSREIPFTDFHFTITISPSLEPNVASKNEYLEGDKELQ